MEVVPEFIEPIIHQGIADGSIQTNHPRELAEAMMLLSDLWINPIVRPTTPEEIQARCAVYNQMFTSFGVPALIGGEIVDTLVRYAEMARHEPLEGAADS